MRLKPLDWTPAFAGVTNFRHCSFLSFRRKPESSGINEEFDVHTIMALLVIESWGRKMAKFRFQDLKIWQLAIQIADELFDIADELEEKKLYRFAEQLRGAGCLCQIT